ncbi:DUF4437 domain-containing protein [Winogradskyella litoriviva]|uniref:DUF4437 domain-containing protein n=1 Tax=Winogradskyella litoriviva TaxID=1220182 RepID=A0ABX2E6G1_9FLAO|nr:DUF4437 domain-containing protein [Winogradskyella litoriviva]NRD23662.1 DUF4437 domain-containing protein [Winogradskyella litoriviva]
MKKIIMVVLLFLAIGVNAQTPKTDDAKSRNEVVTADNVEWGWLNPLRGDKSPAAGNLWGDRTDTLASGFLVKFNKGFSSPPHIHNVTYRGVVIQGLLHNDDENAQEQWLPAGSFWQQPAGEAHITAASGEANMAYIEIQEGPYLVKPTDEAFDNGERPINIDKSNLVWLNASDITWVTDESKVETAFLWGSHKESELSASMLKLPAGFEGEIKNLSPNFRAVIIQGTIAHQASGNEFVNLLEAGSYFGAAEDSTHKITVKDDQEAVIYIRANGKYEVTYK